MGKISELLRPSTWSLLLTDEKRQELHFQIAIGRNSAKIKDVRIKIGMGLVGWVAQTGEVAVIEDVPRDPRFSPEIDGILHPHIKVCCLCPAQEQGSNPRCY